MGNAPKNVPATSDARGHEVCLDCKRTMIYSGKGYWRCTTPDCPVIRQTGPKPDSADAQAMTPTSEMTPEEIAYARCVDKLVVDEHGFGSVPTEWLRAWRARTVSETASSVATSTAPEVVSAEQALAGLKAWNDWWKQSPTEDKLAVSRSTTDERYLAGFEAGLLMAAEECEARALHDVAKVFRDLPRAAPCRPTATNDHAKELRLLRVLVNSARDRASSDAESAKVPGQALQAEGMLAALTYVRRLIDDGIKDAEERAGSCRESPANAPDWQRLYLDAQERFAAFALLLNLGDADWEDVFERGAVLKEVEAKARAFRDANDRYSTRHPAWGNALRELASALVAAESDCARVEEDYGTQGRADLPGSVTGATQGDEASKATEGADGGESRSGERTDEARVEGLGAVADSSSPAQDLSPEVADRVRAVSFGWAMRDCNPAGRNFEDRLVELLAEVRAEEREACAKVLEDFLERHKAAEGLKLWPVRECLQSIRDRAKGGA